MEMFYHLTSIVKDESRCVNLDWSVFSRSCLAAFAYNERSL